MAQRDQFSEFDFDTGPMGPPDKVEPKTDEQMVPISRLNEVSAQRDKAEGQRDEIIQSMLNGAPDQASDPGPSDEELMKVVIPEGTDPDVAAAITPILEANNRAVYERVSSHLNTRVKPVEEKFEYEEAVKNVASRVEGFHEVRQDIVQMFGAMSPEEQKRHNNEQGLETMALRALRERDQNSTSRSSMAHSAPFGSTGLRPAPARKMSEQDVWDMTEEEFEEFEAAQTRQSGG